MALQDKKVFSGFIYGFDLSAHDETWVISVLLVIARDVDPVVLPVDRGKTELDIDEFLLEFIMILEFTLRDDFSHTLNYIILLSGGVYL